MRVGTTVIVILVILALAAVAATALVPQGRPAPGFNLKAPDGKTTLNLAQYKGKVVVLDFWAPWCPPCRAAMPQLQKLYTKYQNQGVVVLGVSEDGPVSSVNAVVKQTKVAYPIAMDAERAVGPAYQVAAYPTLYVIDKTGKIAYSEIGFNNAGVEGAIQRALK